MTAGPTHEPIDDVRFIGNRSSGAMGIALADEAAARGEHCTLLLGPTSLTPAHSSVEVLRFRTTAELQALLHQQFPHCDILVMAAAVADYRPIGQCKGKLPRRSQQLVLRLESTPDLLVGLKPMRKKGQLVMGFALEPERTMLARAAAKLARKGLDLIVANPLETMESPLIRATVLSASGVVLNQRSPVSKRIFARKLVGMLLRSHRAATLS
ncbi:MAG: phosphopantothenoylcysteine decarboxylase [Phycisphaerales bacterium]|nr:phosphopantothenoylcysteine decarboxylase [Phycisphaerales bacterium]